MSNLTCQIRLLKDWHGRRAGAILPLVPAGQARLMVRQKIAEMVKPKRKRKRAAAKKRDSK